MVVFIFQFRVQIFQIDRLLGVFSNNAGLPE